MDTLKHVFQSGVADEGGPHVDVLPSDWNEEHIFDGGSTDGDVLTWKPSESDKASFRTIIGGTGITVTVNPTDITIDATGSGTVTGSGTTDFIPKWTGASSLGDSIMDESVPGQITVTGNQKITGTLFVNDIQGFSPLTITPPDASTIALVVKGFSGQTASLQEWKNSSGATLVSISSTGELFTVTAAFFDDNGDGGSGFGGSLSVTGLLALANDINFFPASGGTRTIKVNAATDASNGTSLTLVAGDAFIGNTNGGSVVIDGGAKDGSGTDGNVVLASVRGFVGVGSGTPDTLLHVFGNAKVTGTLFVNDIQGFSPLVITQPDDTVTVLVVKNSSANPSGKLQEWQRSTGNIAASVFADTIDTTFKLLNVAGTAGFLIDVVDSTQVAEISTDLTGGILFTTAAKFSSVTGPFQVTGTTGISALGQIVALGDAADQVQMVVRGNAAQTANLQEWTNSSNGVLAYVTASGGLDVSSGVRFTGAATGIAANVGMLDQQSNGVRFASYGPNNITRGRITLHQAASDNSLAQDAMVIAADGTITFAVAGAITSSYGGTGQNFSVSSGVPTINAGTWTANDVLTTNRLLVAAAGNTITSFSTLTYDGTTLAVGAVTATGVFKGPDGTTGAPTYTFTSDATTGMYLQGAPQIGFAIGGLTKFSISAGQLTAGSDLAFNFAGSRIIAGTISLSFRNNANSADNLIILDSGAATLRRSLQVGTPTGGDEGTGTINVSVDIFKNGTAYANPDYVLEHWATGRIERFIDNDGAATYNGKMTLEAVEAYARGFYALPLVKEARDRGLGVFGVGDAVLASLEESYLYLFDHERRIADLEAEIVRLREKQ